MAQDALQLYHMATVGVKFNTSADDLHLTYVLVRQLTTYGWNTLRRLSVWCITSACTIVYMVTGLRSGYTVNLSACSKRSLHGLKLTYSQARDWKLRQIYNEHI